MKINLIYAGITESGFGSLKGNEGSWMNHGLAILSSVAKQAGHEVALIDLRRLTGWDDFCKMVSKDKIPVFGLTMMSVDFNNVIKAAKIIRERSPISKIIVGGPHASICPEELAELDCFDHIVRGEGEITFPELLRKIELKESIPHVIQGQSLENLDNAPWADRDIFGCQEEPFVPFLKPPFVTLIAGRGCRYNCNYCQPAERLIFGHKVRRRSAENVIKELIYLRGKLNFSSFMIHDDCITEDRRWVLKFCELVKKEGFTQPFVAQSRADIICRNPDMIRIMQEAGLRLMIIGFESGSDRVLEFLRKGCTRLKNIEAARICRENGVKIWANYMMGLPTETKEEVMETYTMLKEINPYHCSPAFYTPHPGSDLFTIGEQMGIHLITNHDDYRRNTYERKIKGPDYEFLKDMLYKSIALAEDNGAAAQSSEQAIQIEQANLAVFEKYTKRLKVFLMSKSPRFYRFLRKLKYE